MPTVFVRALAFSLMTLTVSGCGPQPKPFPAKTPEQIKQLTDVTDGTVAVIRNPEDKAALQRALAALTAAREQYRQHKDAVLTEANAEVFGCLDAHEIEILDIPTMIEKRDEAASQHDDLAVKRREAVLWSLTSNIGGCAAKASIVLIDMEQRPEALQHGAIVVSEGYATLEIVRAALGLKVALPLQDHIRAYETVLERLGPKHPMPFVTDALPKLKATLAALEASPAHKEPASGQLDQ
jgi:hypothetical protein